MTDDKLSLWNVHIVILITTWKAGLHNQLNKKAGEIKHGLYRLLHFLKEEQGVMETLTSCSQEILPLIPLGK
ncbi:hypothetical protein T02_13904 [Trichinella nativa]|uniref:Uncharacterized protein n=1 Tax=Trichinella nativa TaxID=6335 RepID=A0A0V1KKP7_9BILA|nr:hypothetical protein T02_13904 [Trichinella nativa]